MICSLKLRTMCRISLSVYGATEVPGEAMNEYDEEGSDVVGPKQQLTGVLIGSDDGKRNYGHVRTE